MNKALESNNSPLSSFAAFFFQSSNETAKRSRLIVSSHVVLRLHINHEKPVINSTRFSFSAGERKFDVNN